MGLGSNFGGMGGRRRDEQKEYFVVPKPRQKTVNSQPDEWKVVKGFHERNANTINTYSSKQDAVQRGKELAKKNDTVLTAFDSAKKSSRRFDYR